DYGLGASTSAFLEDYTTWQGNRFIGWSNANPAGPSASLISVGLDMGYAANRRFQIAVGGDGVIYARSALVSDPSDRTSWNAQFSALNSNMLPITAHLAASVDNSQQLGVSQRRWSVVFASTGAINTSDAREKTPVRSLTANEVKAARLLAAEIGIYQWLASVQDKGESDARQHIGMTVQRSIEIMELCDLDPFAYGFICYDAWEDEVEVIPAVYQEIINHEGIASKGALITPELRTVVTPAGDRYSFRTDQLNTFIAAGLRAESDELRARQEDLEARLAALESAA
ncbi:tail fiber domain-containing protein, partial [Pseudomonas putida]|uniref:tail fiber domain-containing protein n=1 Tax=Pseudomonas putida TaxID=303 RepID=UPI001C2D8F44